MMIWINGVELPMPTRGMKIERQQLVDSGRNALGEVVAQKINRRLHKLSDLKWDYLTAATWKTILTEIEKFEGTVKFWDARTRCTFRNKSVLGRCLPKSRSMLIQLLERY